MNLFQFLFVSLSAIVLVKAVDVVLESALPTCALLCLRTEILASSCSLTNTTCQCTNESLVAAIATCVNANCTVRESLITKAFTENECGAPIRDRSSVVVITAMIGMAISFVALALRLISRLTGISGQFWWDDAVLCLAMCLVIPLSTLSIVLSKTGLGRDIWTLNFEQITKIAWIYYWDELMYLSCLSIIKISLLLFYLRVFSEKRFRRMVYFAIVLCLAYMISFDGVTLFQCIPLNGAWKSWDGTFTGRCNNVNLQGWTSAAVNIVLDLIVIILPLPKLWKIDMSNQKRMAITLMFCVGFFITIISILRLTVLVEFGGTTNMSWDYVSVGYWSTIEIHVGIICACLPSIRALLKHIFPRSPLISQQRASKFATGFASFVQDPDRGDASAQPPSKPKRKETEDFVPLVDLDSVNHSHLYIYKIPSSNINRILDRKSELDLSLEETRSHAS